MERWGWLVGYLLLFVLLHAVLYLVYVRQAGTKERPTSSITEGSHSHPGSPPSEGYARRPDSRAERSRYGDPSALEATMTFDGPTVTCRQCGATNEADGSYTYCWHCISGLRL